MKQQTNLEVKRVHLYNLKKCLSVSKILNRCGKDMAKKYGLHHWDNSILKSCIIVIICLLKNHIYLLTDKATPVATFQLKMQEGNLIFEKLAVIPEVSGKGYGSYCIKLIEAQARKLDCHKIRMEVYDQSKHAINFYVKQGYSQIGKIDTIKYTELIMEKNIRN